MPYNLSIPGQVSEFQLRAIEIVAGLVPKGGTVVEVGSLFGASSWAWANSVDPSVTVYCIDPWEKNAGVRSMEERYGVTYGLEQFQRYTADCPNIRPIRGYSPRDFRDWAEPVDLYYEDAVHTDPILSENLAMWTSRLAPGGIVCGDDHRPRFPDVRNGATRLARLLQRTLITADFFWCLLPDEAERPGSLQAASRLRALSNESIAARRKLGPQVAIGPLKPLGSVPEGERPAVTLRACNAGLDPWPPTKQGELRASLRVTSESAPAEILAAEEVGLGQATLLPDLCCDTTLPLPVAVLPPGRYRAIFDLRIGEGPWLLRPDPVRAKGAPFEIAARPKA